MDLVRALEMTEPRMLDGAMGTELAAAGLEMGGQNCLSHPEAVLAVHRSYVECGVDMLITNTLTMNRLAIEHHRLDVDVHDVNVAGARLARQAATGGQAVLGDISGTGQLLEPYGTLPEAAAYAAFYEQATALVDGGVDGFLIETMFDLHEAVVALRACRDVAKASGRPLPAMVTMAFATPARGGRTLMGNTAKACAEALSAEGAAAIGANCGDLGPAQLAEIVATLTAATSLPVLVQPNAGTPRLEGSRTVFDLSAQAFVEGMALCLAAGARLVGGCCGTNASHIQALAALLGRA